jgi:ABC-type enterochelin transport system permease subunit
LRSGVTCCRIKRRTASSRLIETDSGTLHSIKLGLVTVVLFASACVVETKALLALVSAPLF